MTSLKQILPEEVEPLLPYIVSLDIEKVSFVFPPNLMEYNPGLFMRIFKSVRIDGLFTNGSPQKVTCWFKPKTIDNIKKQLLLKS